MVVAGEDVSVAIRGKATLLDRLPASFDELARAPFGLPAFAARNVREMAAFARDVARGGAQPQPPVPVSVRVETLDLLDGWPARAVLGWMAPGGRRAPGEMGPAQRAGAGPGCSL